MPKRGHGGYTKEELDALEPLDQKILSEYYAAQAAALPPMPEPGAKTPTDYLKDAPGTDMISDLIQLIQKLPDLDIGIDSASDEEVIAQLQAVREWLRTKIGAQSILTSRGTGNAPPRRTQYDLHSMPTDDWDAVQRLRVSKSTDPASLVRDIVQNVHNLFPMTRVPSKKEMIECLMLNLTNLTELSKQGELVTDAAREIKEILKAKSVLLQSVFDEPRGTEFFKFLIEKFSALENPAYDERVRKQEEVDAALERERLRVEMRLGRVPSSAAASSSSSSSSAQPPMVLSRTPSGASSSGAASSGHGTRSATPASAASADGAPPSPPKRRRTQPPNG